MKLPLATPLRGMKGRAEKHTLIVACLRYIGCNFRLRSRRINSAEVRETVEFFWANSWQFTGAVRQFLEVALILAGYIKDPDGHWRVNHIELGAGLNRFLEDLHKKPVKVPQEETKPPRHNH